MSDIENDNEIEYNLYSEIDNNEINNKICCFYLDENDNQDNIYFDVFFIFYLFSGIDLMIYVIIFVFVQQIFQKVLSINLYIIRVINILFNYLNEKHITISLNFIILLIIYLIIYKYINIIFWFYISIAILLLIIIVFYCYIFTSLLLKKVKRRCYYLLLLHILYQFIYLDLLNITTLFGF